ncbi:MAG: Ig domain-containing protein [Bacteroidales bacterium]|nr:Ig domain-containing protein [Bacteroidales bacterium]
MPKPLKVSVTGITLDKTDVTVSYPQDFLLNATIQPANATNKEIDWTSSSIMIATVTHYADNPCIGSVTGIAPGTAIIKAKTMDGGYEATCKVTVQ